MFYANFSQSFAKEIIIAFANRHRLYYYFLKSLKQSIVNSWEIVWPVTALMTNRVHVGAF